ncbi:22670_t:CDS:2 [Cetraspora pellucida]|uniref:22670_t:CDS:1 n=1 Tax=Cetraspora pellucida TaxID=1433469 RepID=A0A9N9A6A3_9GLOM|nr:22670_t:CDS:2 [Cetraspora pellucida]
MRALATQLNTTSITHRQPQPSSNPSPSNHQHQVPSIIESIEPIHPNAVAQKNIVETISKLEAELTELKTIATIATNPQCSRNLSFQITEIQKNITEEQEWLKKLKRHASNQQKSQEKKLRALNKKSIVIRYDSPREANAQRRHKIIKVRTIQHLRDTLEDNYNIYMSHTSMRNYILLCSNCSLTFRTHHHPTFIGIASISRDEKKNYVDEHYCLAFVRNSKQFALTFADFAIVLLQDNKAKVLVSILAIEKHFWTMQSINEPVSVLDHDFPVGTSQKLIPSVYLMINLKESNESLQHGQLAIFIRARWHISLSSASHITDIISLSAYNPVKRSMAMLLEKITGIILKIDQFGNHLNSYSEVCNYKLGLHNFQHAGQTLANLWKKDPINRKPVYVEYVDEQNDLCTEVRFTTPKETGMQDLKENDSLVPWSWIESHSSDAAAFLGKSNGFLPLVTKGKDGHYLNAMHMLQYFNNLKIPAYDAHLPFLLAEDHSRRCCKICNKYFPTTAMLVKHKKTIHSNNQARSLNQWCQQTNSATLDDFSLLSLLSEIWPQVVIMQSQSLSDIE